MNFVLQKVLMVVELNEAHPHSREQIFLNVMFVNCNNRFTQAWLENSHHM